MSVSRDFIDSYSPEVRNHPEGPGRRLREGTLQRTGAHCGDIKLVFGFRAAQDLFKALISLPETRRLVLALGEKSLDRLMQANGFVDLGAGAGPIGAEADELLHVGICRHYPPSPVDDRQVGGVGSPRHGA